VKEYKEQCVKTDFIYLKKVMENTRKPQIEVGALQFAQHCCKLLQRAVLAVMRSLPLPLPMLSAFLPTYCAYRPIRVEAPAIDKFIHREQEQTRI
jgi:hypothetical protein